MKRISVLFQAALVLIAGAVIVSAQVPLEKEPHHKVLLDTLLLRILEITVPPGAMTLDHRHEFDIATVALGNASTRTKRPAEEWGAPRIRPLGSPDLVEYTGKPTVHMVENIDKTPYHLIAVENYRTGTWPARKAITAPATTLAKETRSFAVYDVNLTAAEPATEHAHDVPAVVILVSGEITNQGTNGEEPYPVRGAGKWVLVPAAQTHAMQVAGSGDAHIVEVEVR
jgi:quercetin dioxygenase-like cupin family protein